MAPEKFLLSFFQFFDSFFLQAKTGKKKLDFFLCLFQIVKKGMHECRESVFFKLFSYVHMKIIRSSLSNKFGKHVQNVSL